MESLEVNANLHLEINKCLGREKELEGINQMLKDEHQALQLAFASLEEKLRKTQVCVIQMLFPQLLGSTSSYLSATLLMQVSFRYYFCVIF